MANLANIKHIVVLMLENRSFDNVFGFLRPASTDFDGLLGDASANNDGVKPWPTPDGIDCSNVPNPDPGEQFDDITQQIFNGGPTATMEGFRANYAKNKGKADDIMHCFRPADLPALSTLANAYAVCDQWFASAPCQTWPNRFFVHSGTANGNENNTMAGFPYQMQTIFNELDGVAAWRIYFHDFPQAALLHRLWPGFANFRLFDEFLTDAANGALPGYAFIEPRYYPSATALPNDMHPPHNVRRADALVAQVYNAVRKSPNWATTLLVVTFDEHGGCYDHVPPPRAIPPEPPRPDQFEFNRYGVRVPAVVISPYTAAGTMLRVTPGTQPFDHTSIIRTVRNCFGIAGPLSAREAGAPDLSGALNTGFDPNHAPLEVAVAPPVPTPAEIEAALSSETNDLQDLLEQVAKNIAPLANDISIEQHLQDLLNAKLGTSAKTAGTTGDYARNVMQGILARFHP
jgi:phospholipase C